MPQTSEMRFGTEASGLFLAREDCQRYMGALHAVLAGRNDPISMATAEELLELLKESNDDTEGLVLCLKPIPACVADALRTELHQTPNWTIPPYAEIACQGCGFHICGCSRSLTVQT